MSEKYTPQELKKMGGRTVEDAKAVLGGAEYVQDTIDGETQPPRLELTEDQVAEAAKENPAEKVALVKVRQDIEHAISLEGDIVEQRRGGLGLEEATLKTVEKENKLRTSTWKKFWRNFGYLVKANAVPYDTELMAHLIEEVGGSVVEKMARLVNDPQRQIEDAKKSKLLNLMDRASTLINETIRSEIKRNSGLVQNVMTAVSQEVRLKQVAGLVDNPQWVVRMLGESIERVSQGDLVEVLAVLQLMQLESTSTEEDGVSERPSVYFNKKALEFINSIVTPFRHDERPYVKESIVQLDEFMRRKGCVWHDTDGYKKVAQLGGK